MYNPGPSFYMQKLVVSEEARNVIDLDAPVKDTIANVAKATGKDINDIVVFILDKPRHQKIIQEVREVGARILLHTDGDLTGALMVCDPNTDVDIMMGVGGSPEGVISACAIKGMGGQILARLDPQSYLEKEAIEKAGIDTREILSVETLVRGDDAFFAATGISGGDLLKGVTYSKNGATTQSMVIRAKTGTFRYIQSHHNWDRLMKISSVKYD